MGFIKSDSLAVWYTLVPPILTTLPGTKYALSKISLMRAPNALNSHNERILINVCDSHIADILISKTMLSAIRKV